jgi:transcriptional regulator with XRE-family HTH domain
MTEAFRPTAAERAIGRELERWRRSRDLSLVELGRLVGCSNAKLSKLENALWPVAPGDVVAIGMACKIDDDERNALFDKATWARRNRLLGDDTVIFDAARDYIELEFEASMVQTFRIDLVPGLFQTADYTRAVAKADDPIRGEVTAIQQITMRAARQERLTGKNPLRVEAVVVEGVLHHAMGGPKAMRQQLLHLMRLAELETVSIQVVPFKAGGYPAMGSPFNILSFTHELHDSVVYTENVMEGSYSERPGELERYTLSFASLQRVALSPGDSVEFIAEVASNL